MVRVRAREREKKEIESSHNITKNYAKSFKSFRLKSLRSLITLHFLHKSQTNRNAQLFERQVCFYLRFLSEIRNPKNV